MAVKPRFEFVQNCTDSPSYQAQNIGVLSGDLIETQALTVRCPTCGAGPRMRCKLVMGGVRPQSHLERRLIASDKVVRKLEPKRPRN